MTPRPDEQLKALGYPLDLPKWNDTALRVSGSGAKRLRDVVPGPVRRQLEANGFPDLDLEIVFVEGGLAPGVSGGPIVNAAGQLVAIADGGLERGAVGISWGIPASQLNALETSTAKVVTSQTRLRALFAADLDLDLGGSIECGNLKLRKIRERTFTVGELSELSDDSLGLSQLLANFFFLLDEQSFAFVIYQDIDSGATAVLPADLTPRRRGETCSADLSDGSSGQRLWVARMPNSEQSQIQQTSVRFEELIAGEFDEILWQPDPTWSYLAPKVRLDGTVVTRKAFNGMRLDPLYGPVPAKYAFETLAARGHAFIGSAAIRHRVDVRVLQMQMICGQEPHQPGCTQLFEAARSRPASRGNKQDSPAVSRMAAAPPAPGGRWHKIPGSSEGSTTTLQAFSPGPQRAYRAQAGQTSSLLQAGFQKGCPFRCRRMGPVN